MRKKGLKKGLVVTTRTLVDGWGPATSVALELIVVRLGPQITVAKVTIALRDRVLKISAANKTTFILQFTM
jgi:hypothetical protein